MAVSITTHDYGTQGYDYYCDITFSNISPSSGDLLLVFAVCDSPGTHTYTTDGWTRQHTLNNEGAASVGYIISDGTETSVRIEGGYGSWIAVCLQITGHAATGTIDGSNYDIFYYTSPGNTGSATPTAPGFAVAFIGVESFASSFGVPDGFTNSFVYQDAEYYSGIAAHWATKSYSSGAQSTAFEGESVATYNGNIVLIKAGAVPSPAPRANLQGPFFGPLGGPIL